MEIGYESVKHSFGCSGHRWLCCNLNPVEVCCTWVDNWEHVNRLKVLSFRVQIQKLRLRRIRNGGLKGGFAGLIEKPTATGVSSRSGKECPEAVVLGQEKRLCCCLQNERWSGGD
jgi:hypothetical protein